MGLTSHEQKILDSIYVASENDPLKPEFPPESPRFPATPTIPIKVPPFTNVWIKDESKNPTGTHKDRMAWEVIVTYRDFLIAKKANRWFGPLPQMSIITSGTAGIAVQTALRKYKLPNLKCLVDIETPDNVVKALSFLGCEIYKTDLSRKPLHWKEILELTENPTGIDITSNEALDPRTRFYDWLSYEIINESPDYCFLPYGSGTLFENVLNVNKKEVLSQIHDPRFQGDVEILKDCNFIGSTVNNARSVADKLYAPHRPFSIFEQQWVAVYKLTGCCGKETDVQVVRERFFQEAMKIAEAQGIECEPSGIAGLALLLQMQDKIHRNKKILIVSTGKTKYPVINIKKKK